MPITVLHRLTKDPKQKSEARLQPLEAALLFADISGFTKLTEAMAKLGPQGAEALTKHLSRYFGRLVSIVNSHGGDVVKFAGARSALGILLLSLPPPLFWRVLTAPRSFQATPSSLPSTKT